MTTQLEQSHNLDNHATVITTQTQSDSHAMRLALKTIKLLATIPKASPSFSQTRTVILPFHSRRPAKTLLRLTTPSFHSILCTPMSTLQVKSNLSSTAEEDKIKLSAIKLSAIEQSIFDRLLATLHHFQLQTQLRVAGGWVRDKLLGKDCYDIDIALDNMLGTEFVDKVREYLQSIGEDAQGVCVIESNPDQSKHLETARMRLFDMWIDFVNLRSEEYTENSRIPSKQRFGTAKEDAYRRDLTINSLFYNINTAAVEDFTGRGISHLESRKIVTPLPPKATFLDDPLRVLRAIRFAARFEFTLDEYLKEAAACDDVKDALATKISRERIGTEIDLMISGNQPVIAMTYIRELTLFWIVFSLPAEYEPAISDGCESRCISDMDNAQNLIHLLGESTFTAEQRRLTLCAALFLPLRNTTYTEKKAKKIPVVNHIIRESLKRKAKDAEMVLDLHRASYKFLSLIPYLTSSEDIQVVDLDWMRDLIDVPVSSKVRVLTGFLLREIKDFWQVALLISILLHPIDVGDTEDEYSQLGNRRDLFKAVENSKRRDLFKAVENSIIKLGLEKVWDVKQLINGKDVMSTLQLKGGPLVKEWLDKAMAWQLAFPSGTAEECIEWLREANSKRVKLE